MWDSVQKEAQKQHVILGSVALWKVGLVKKHLF